MMKRMLVVGAVLVLGGFSSQAWASLIVDGSVNTGEYGHVLVDSEAPGQLYQDTGLDIDSLYYDRANIGGVDYVQFGLTVDVLASYDMDGDPSSALGETQFWAVFYDSTHTTRQYRVEISTDASGVTSFGLAQWTGAWTTVALGAGDYSVNVGTALEFRIKADKLTGLDMTPYVFGQLDGRGNWPDDQITGIVPEPATLGLMACGLVASLICRRRRS